MSHHSYKKFMTVILVRSDFKTLTTVLRDKLKTQKAKPVKNDIRNKNK